MAYSVQENFTTLMVGPSPRYSDAFLLSAYGEAREVISVKYQSLILTEKIIDLLDEAEASEVEKLSCLHAALAIVPTTKGTNYARTVEVKKEPSFR